MEKLSLYVGIGAGVLTAVSLLPQLIKLIKQKKAGDVSLMMYVILLTGVAGWIAYGVLKEDYPIIVTNGFSFVVNTLIIIFSYRYKKNENESE